MVVTELGSMKIGLRSFCLSLQPRCSVGAMTPGNVGPVKKEPPSKEEHLCVLAFSLMSAHRDSCSKIPLKGLLQ